MDEFWVCENCRSLNRVKSSKCYSCKASRGATPAPPPAASRGGAGSSAPAPTAYRPTPLPGPPLPSGADPAPFGRQAAFAQQVPPQAPSAPQAPSGQGGQPGPGPAPTTFGQSTVPFSGYPSTAPPAPPIGSRPQVMPAVAWAPQTVPPQTVAPKSNARALSVIFGLALVVVVAAGAIIVVAPGLMKSTNSSYLAAASPSATPVMTASPTPEITATPTPQPTPTPRPSLAAAPAPKGYQQIVSPDLDYALSFPAGWVSVSEEDPRPIADQIASIKKAYPSLAQLVDGETASLDQEYRVVMFDPAANSARKMMAGLFAVTDAVPAEDLKAGQAALKSELSSLGNITGLTITSIKEPAGPTLKAIGGMSPSGVPVKLVMYLIAAKNHAFVLVFVTTSTSYSAYAKTYDAIAAAIQEPPLS